MAKSMKNIEHSAQDTPGHPTCSQHQARTNTQSDNEPYSLQRWVDQAPCEEPWSAAGRLPAAIPDSRSDISDGGQRGSQVHHTIDLRYARLRYIASCILMTGITANERVLRTGDPSETAHEEHKRSCGSE